MKLGQPSGGASVGDNVECRITVTNDILPGKIDFEKPAIVIKQTDEEIVVPLKRTQYTEGLIVDCLKNIPDFISSNKLLQTK